MNAGSSAEKKARRERKGCGKTFEMQSQLLLEAKAKRKIEMEKPAKSFLIEPQMWLEQWLMSSFWFALFFPSFFVYPSSKLIGSSYTSYWKSNFHKFSRSNLSRAENVSSCVAFLHLPRPFELPHSWHANYECNQFLPHSHTLQNRLDCRTHL